jgi:RNA recognition motif-containing protein
MHLNQGSHPL